MGLTAARVYSVQVSELRDEALDLLRHVVSGLTGNRVDGAPGAWIKVEGLLLNKVRPLV